MENCVSVEWIEEGRSGAAFLPGRCFSPHPSATAFATCVPTSGKSGARCPGGWVYSKPPNVIAYSDNKLFQGELRAGEMGSRYPSKTGSE